MHQDIVSRLFALATINLDSNTCASDLLHATITYYFRQYIGISIVFANDYFAVSR